jgi:hypothetical protein
LVLLPYILRDICQSQTASVSRPIANIYDLLIGDHIDAARERNLDAIARKTKKILADRNLETTAPIPEQIAIPHLEFARGETRDEMQDLWARLLANAMDPARQDAVRPEFVTALEKIHPIDAVVLEHMAESGTENFRLATHVAEPLGIRASSAQVSLANLETARCVKSTQNPHSEEPYYRCSGFGLELLLACRP